MKFHFKPAGFRLKTFVSPRFIFFICFIISLFHVLGPRKFSPREFHLDDALHALSIVNHASARVLLFARRFTRVSITGSRVLAARGSWREAQREIDFGNATLEMRRCNFGYSEMMMEFSTPFVLLIIVSHNQTSSSRW